MNTLPDLCPCTSGIAFDQCCGHYHINHNAPTALTLMKSRYSAFCMGDIDYIVHTMKGKASLAFNPDETKSWAASVYWLGLDIITTYNDPINQDKAFVEFIARFMTKDTIQCIHERSEFTRIEGRWYYVDGTKPLNTHSPKSQKIPRNAPCPCNSLKKFKNCHG